MCDPEDPEDPYRTDVDGNREPEKYDPNWHCGCGAPWGQPCGAYDYDGYDWKYKRVRAELLPDEPKG